MFADHTNPFAAHLLGERAMSEEPGVEPLYIVQKYACGEWQDLLLQSPQRLELARREIDWLNRDPRTHNPLRLRRVN